jgi:membrane associated rhomboid family serine protease
LFPIRDLNPTRIFPVVTIGLILLNVAVFIFWQPHDNINQEDAFLYRNAAISCEITTGAPLSQIEMSTQQCVDNGAPSVYPDKNVWLAVVVSMFLHGSIAHIVFNMWFLWIFGNNIEEAYGFLGYLVMYLVCGLGAAAAFVFSNPNATVPMIGASGAIAGVLGAYLVLFPRNRVLTLLLFFFVQVPAWLYLVVWFGLQFATQDTGVAWQAHVGGFLVGVVITLILRPALLARVRRIHQPIVGYRTA